MFFVPYVIQSIDGQPLYPGKELYTYQIKAVIEFLKSVGEI